ncbi:hypothetical protein LZ32DRAFT_333561 [Colletotrichum eremochloae]|nr:hypothetical protein LZ32DRAFT_333561 [Colletotrichum eremochloae]
MRPRWWWVLGVSPKPSVTSDDAVADSYWLEVNTWIGGDQPWVACWASQRPPPRRDIRQPGFLNLGRQLSILDANPVSDISGKKRNKLSGSALYDNHAWLQGKAAGRRATEESSLHKDKQYSSSTASSSPC